MVGNRNSLNRQQRSFPWGVLYIGIVTGALLMFLVNLNDNDPMDEDGNVDKKAEIKSKRIEPTFDFYTLLPEVEVLVSQSKNTKQPTVTSRPQRQKTANNDGGNIHYMLQVGSFRNLSDATIFKAKLDFLGVESKIQIVTIDNKDTWHRVQLGPVIGRDKADSLQKRLKQQEIESLLMRVRP